MELEEGEIPEEEPSRPFPKKRKNMEVVEIAEEEPSRTFAKKRKNPEPEDFFRCEDAKYILYHEDGKYWFCNICQSKVISGISSHINGQQHRSLKRDSVAFTTKAEIDWDMNIFSENIVRSKTKWFCLICEVVITGGKRNLWEHINGVRHGRARVQTLNFELQMRKRTRERMDKPTSSQEDQTKQSTSHKIRLILNAVSLSSGNSVNRESDFLKRYYANKKLQNTHLRCNFCDEISRSQLLCQIHQFSSHPIESAALKEILNARK